MNIFDHIVRFFQGGGLMMYPIAAVLVVGISIAIERWIYLTHAALRNRGLWSQIAPLLARAITEVFSDGSDTSLFDGQT